MNYEYQCPDCQKNTNGSSTADYSFDEEIECPWCGRVLRIRNILCILEVEQTNKKTSPTELEKLEKMMESK